MEKLTIIPLGTVSPYCKNEMNCPGFLIKYKDQNILLDCGNGITRYLNFPNDLKNMSVIISHYHKDHYGDLGVLQYASYVYHNLGKLEEPINIYLPKNDFNCSKESIILNKESYANYIDIEENQIYEIDDLKITFYNNHSHTIDSYMIKLEINDKKVVYTSDIGTTNLKGVVDFCSNADILICESSFLLEHNSNSKTHLNAYDAGIIAKSANVKKLVLTHFWPEEDKNIYLEEAKEFFSNIEVAIENSKIDLFF